MLSTKNVLPNFLKTVLFTAAASLSFSAFSGDFQVSDLKDITVEETTILTDDATKQAEAEALEAQAELENEIETPAE